MLPVPRKPQLHDREELARKLRLALHARDWNQSDLARAAGLSRELISTYCRGTSYPTPRSLRRMAEALNMKPEELSPQAPGLFQWEPPPTMEITGMANGMARITLNTVVPMGVALRIGQLIEGAQDPG